MKDLSKFDIPKKKIEASKQAEKPQEQVNSRKKKLVVIAIVCLLAVAVGSKIVNKHLKKKKTQEQALLAVSPENKKDIVETKTTPKKKAKADEKSDSKKMIFTFYDHLKNESVEVDAAPSAQRAHYKYQYIYQIASFRNMNETSYYVKKMKAQGLEPQFKRVGSWIRMYIGPYDSTRAIAPDIIKLQRMGLNGGFTREISRTKIKPKDTSKKNTVNTKIADDKAETAKLEL